MVATMRPMSTSTAHQIVALSAVLVDIANGAPAEIKLIPAGSFRSARDNRPVGIPAWKIDATAATAILSAQAELQSQFLIDYDHQTLRADLNGQRAPAAGWGGKLEWREGDGLYATEVQWTEAALSAIGNKEYRYISPVIKFDPKTGVVTGVPMAALVNYPALDGLNDLAAAAAMLFSTPNPGNSMDKILTVLGLAAGADEAAVCQAIESLQAKLTANDAQVAALSAQVSNPDPAKYMPVDVVKELQTQLAALSTQVQTGEIDKMIEANLAKLPTPGLQDWARKQSVAALSAYLETAPEIAALAGMQTDGKKPTGEATDALSASGIVALATKYQAEQAALGISINDIAAINHVRSSHVQK